CRAASPRAASRAVRNGPGWRWTARAGSGKAQRSPAPGPARKPRTPRLARTSRWHRRSCAQSRRGLATHSHRADRPSVLLQLLGEHHDDAAGTADVRELVNVLIGRDAAKRTAAVPRGYLKGFVDVVDREGNP